MARDQGKELAKDDKKENVVDLRHHIAPDPRPSLPLDD